MAVKRSALHRAGKDGAASDGATPPKDSRQQALIEAATKIFAERGYDAATTREIAQEAGCAEGLIRWYFGGKSGLLNAVMKTLVKTTREERSAPTNEPGDLAHEIEDTLLTRMDRIWERREAMRIGFSQALVRPELGRTVGRGIHEEGLRQLREMLERHDRAGHIKRGTDLEATAYAIGGMASYAGFLCQCVWEVDREQLRRVMKGYAALLAEAIVEKASVPA